MKILVPTKRVPDSDQKIRANAEGTAVETQHIPHIVNPFDAIALEEALRIRESAENGDDPAEPVEIVAVGIGAADYEEQLRTALAMGADRAVRVAVEDVLDPWNVASVLKAMVEREQSALVLMGKQAIDDDSNQAGQFLAAQLGWPQATFASQIEFVDEGLRVTRETDSGTEILSLELPAVVTVDLRLNEPRYASLPSILKAKKKTIEEVPIELLDVAVEPRIHMLRVTSEESQRKCIHVENVDDLLAHLREEAEAS